MKTQKNSEPKSAPATPGKTTSEITVQDEFVTLSGTLAAELQQWLANPSPRNLAVMRHCFGAFAGMPPENLKKVQIELPATLLEWAEEEAQEVNQTVSELVREVLEAQLYQSERMHHTTTKLAVCSMPQPQRFRLTGDLMAPAYQDGDIITVDDDKPKNGEGALVKLKDGTTIFRRYHEENGMVHLRVDKAGFPELKLSPDQIEFARPAKELCRPVTYQPMRKATKGSK
jgi:hypothetical protein